MFWSKQIASIGLLCSVGFLTVVPANAAEIRILTNAVETSTDVTSLPSRVPTSMSLRACHSCPTQLVKLDETTRFFAGQNSKQEVSFAQLLQACGRSSMGFGVTYDVRTKVVSRIVTACSLPVTDTETER